MSELPHFTQQQIAASRPRGRRNARGGRPARAAAGSAAAPTGPAKGAARERYATAVPAANGNRAVTTAAPAAPGGDSTKILVSNLPFDVNEPQIKVSHQP